MSWCKLLFKEYGPNVVRQISTFLLGCAVISLLVGCIFLPKEEEVLAPPIKEPPKVTYETEEVKTGTIERKIMGTGYFVSTLQQDLYFKYNSGRLKGLFVNEGDKVKKGALIAELDTDSLESQIKQQEIALRLAQMDYEYALNSGESKHNIERASLVAKSAQIRLDELIGEFNKSKLISPVEGVIIYKKDINIGETIDAYDTLVCIADPSKLQLQYIANEDSFEFQLGMKVDIKFKNNMYKGTVVMIPANMPENVSEDLKKAVRINLDKLPEDASIGSDAMITFTLEKKENVVVISTNLIRMASGRKFVHVLVNGVREERDLQIGIQSKTEAEIVKGLEVGDKIIIR